MVCVREKEGEEWGEEGGGGGEEKKGRGRR